MNKEKKLILILVVIGSLIFLLVLFPTLMFFNKKSWNTSEKKIAQQSEENTSLGTTKSSSTNQTETGLIDNESTIKSNPIVKQTRKDAEKLPQTIIDAYKTVDECNKINNVQEKDFCIILWAEHAKNSSFCDKLSADMKVECLDRVTISNAISEKKLDICSGIESESYRKSCIYRIINNENFYTPDCRVLSGEDEKYCRIQSGIRGKKNIADCQSIVDSEIKAFCLNNFYYNLTD